MSKEKSESSGEVEAGQTSNPEPPEVGDEKATQIAEPAVPESSDGKATTNLPKAEPVVLAAEDVPRAPGPQRPDAITALPATRRGDKTRERLHRASAVARGVMEEPAKQVEKIRHASSIVIEEASYDPSLRFVLVALGLFLVFIVLLVLSKVMG